MTTSEYRRLIRRSFTAPRLGRARPSSRGRLPLEHLHDVELGEVDGEATWSSCTCVSSSGVTLSTMPMGMSGGMTELLESAGQDGVAGLDRVVQVDLAVDDEPVRSRHRRGRRRGPGWTPTRTPTMKSGSLASCTTDRVVLTRLSRPTSPPEPSRELVTTGMPDRRGRRPSPCRSRAGSRRSWRTAPRTTRAIWVGMLPAKPRLSCSFRRSSCSWAFCSASSDVSSSSSFAWSSAVAALRSS